MKREELRSSDSLRHRLYVEVDRLPRLRFWVPVNIAFASLYRQLRQLRNVELNIGEDNAQNNQN